MGIRLATSFLSGSLELSHESIQISSHSLRLLSHLWIASMALLGGANALEIPVWSQVLDLGSKLFAIIWSIEIHVSNKPDGQALTISP